jgi:hypothetical protein
MSHAIACPQCAARFRVSPTMFGRKFGCPKCGQAFVIPGGGTAKRDDSGPAPAPAFSFLPWLLLATPLLLLLFMVVVAGGAVAVHMYQQSHPHSNPPAVVHAADDVKPDGDSDKPLRPPLPPPEHHDDPMPPPKPPTVAIDRTEPPEPISGKKLTIHLTGTTDDATLPRYQYRTDPRGEWRPVAGDHIELPELAPGTHMVQVRALDGSDQASRPVHRTWTVKAPTTPTAVPTYTIDDMGVVRLKELPPVKTDNKSSLIKKYRPRITLTASSTWGGWPPENAVDDNLETSWFSAQDDAAAKGTTPWLQVNFPVDVEVSRVTILGNRDPAWLVGFTILEGKVTLYDKNGKELKVVQNKGTGNFRDFDFLFEMPIKGVRAVRFTSLKDQGNQTVYGDIAIAEIQVE